ncbi:MAG TPA: hypothetical protein PLP79_06380 [Prolixibacteraceae bacterium]|nr:hypothetical protein [Prolixibacteraceae bacterium]HPI34064.1 hypothetical protein [Prolixibacteraceae bacterium]HPN76756.1 hypothetical protein [Prolixibacteraceae bacterium]
MSMRGSTFNGGSFSGEAVNGAFGKLRRMVSLTRLRMAEAGRKNSIANWRPVRSAAIAEGENVQTIKTN